MKVLVAEDDPISRRVLQAMLGDWGYEVVTATDGNEAWAILERDDAPTIAIVDWVMPGTDGIELCRRIRRRSDERYVYVLMLTSRHETRHVVEAMEAGADDYVSKPFDEKELRVRVGAAQRLVALQQALRIQATHDALIGTLNRGAIIDILERDLARSAREGTSVGVAMADLDHFKRINDAQGHLIGDAVLREAARRMRSTLRKYDALGRFGGEEFLLVLPDTDLEDSLAAAERTRAAVASEPVSTEAGPVLVTISIGVAATVPGRPVSIKHVLHAADEALYRAKANGRNRVEAATHVEPRESG